jgi:hypothetical protein
MNPNVKYLVTLDYKNIYSSLTLLILVCNGIIARCFNCSGLAILKCVENKIATVIMIFL